MELLELKRKANDIRKQAVTLLYTAQQAHIGGSLSCTDYLTALYYEKMNISPENSRDENRDRFILSKGHCVEGYYSILADLGFFPKEELATYCQFGTRLIAHPDQVVPGIEMNTGSLGHGLGGACGMALAGKRAGASYRVYALMGDGELAEGSVWEALMFAGNYKLDNLYAAVDRNHLQIGGPTEDIMKLEPLEERFRSFGFAVETIDGNDIDCILKALTRMETIKDKPKMLILDTVKGKGVSFMENKREWHHGSISEELYNRAITDLNKIEEELR